MNEGKKAVTGGGKAPRRHTKECLSKGDAFIPDNSGGGTWESWKDDRPNYKASAPETRAEQPGTTDIDAALARDKAYTRKLHAEVQDIIAKRSHHPSCKESDKDLIWHCNQCGENESAESVLTERDAARAQAAALAAALRDMMHDLDILYGKYREPGNKYLANAKSALAAWEAAQ